MGKALIAGAQCYFDSQSGGWRFGDVVDFVHPTPSDDSQSMLFRHAIKCPLRAWRRRPEVLRTLAANRTIHTEPLDVILTMTADGSLADRLAVPE